MTTTRIGLISDVHGNEIALEAVLEKLRDVRVDRIVCLGDVAALGPRPVAVLQQLEDIGCECLLGNHDEFMIQPELVLGYAKVPLIAAAVEWCHAQLTTRELDFIRTFKRTLELPLDSVNRLALFHGTPESNTTDLLATTPRDVVDEMIREHEAQVMAGGHTHIQMLRQHRGMLIVNPGSVGMPFKEYVGGGPPEILCQAEFAVVESNNGSITVELYRLPLDRRSLRSAALSVDFPMSTPLAQHYA
ncbi:MAG TPA: metallophosphoesterase family protein [Polyangiaceae bacterium]